MENQNKNNKECRRCFIVKPIADFRFCKDTKDKLQTWCDDCKREYGIIHYQKNKDKSNERRRQYYKDHKK